MEYEVHTSRETIDFIKKTCIFRGDFLRSIYNRNSYSNGSLVGRATAVQFGTTKKFARDRTVLEGYLKLEGLLQNIAGRRALLTLCETLFPGVF